MQKTDICNMALAYIGRGQIVDIESDDEAARQCKRHYDNTRRLLLRQYEWSFARRQEKLVALTETINGFAHSYMYPEKCIKAIAVVEEGKAYDPFRQHDFEVLNVDNNTKCIATNIGNAFLDYIYDVTDADIFDQLFIEALARKLASNLVMALAGDHKMADAQYSMYQAALQEAKSLQAKERNRRLEFPNGYAKARGGD